MLGPRKYSIVLIGYFVLGLLLLLGLGDCHIIRVSLHVELIAWAVIEGGEFSPYQDVWLEKITGSWTLFYESLSKIYLLFYFLFSDREHCDQSNMLSIKDDQAKLSIKFPQRGSPNGTVTTWPRINKHLHREHLNNLWYDDPVCHMVCIFHLFSTFVSCSHLQVIGDSHLSRLDINAHENPLISSPLSVKSEKSLALWNSCHAMPGQ